jgi:hypothetical protein
MFNYKSCNDLSCNICIFADKNYFIKINEHFPLPSYINSSCYTTVIVYIIKCNLFLNVNYIGESSNSA